MITKRILILAPAVILAILLQSYYWVPTYTKQTKGNPHRLTEDTASSEIENKVFEGLIDRDENLLLRGRLATGWEISEEAYFYINESAEIPEMGKLTPEKMIDFFHQTLDWDHLADVSLIPPHTYVTTRPVDTESGAGEGKLIEFQVSAPARIKFSLTRVDPALFDRLAKILGPSYFSDFKATRYVQSRQEMPGDSVANHARFLLPVTEHNPVLLFHLRPGVRFHDGHLFDADDVKFTYESIMNPGNLSPRIADYEPVKELTVIDPLTVRIVYKRLFSPAITSWSIGILPTHLLNAEALKKEAVSRGKDPDNFTIRHSRFNRKPVGCGPFRFSQWKSDQYIELDRFDEYWDGPPNYVRYVYRIIPDPLTQEMEFYAGTIDNYDVQPHQVNRLIKDDRFQKFSGTSFGYSYIGYNLRRKPFDDSRVRRALGMAIDTEQIIKYVLYGQGERITGPFLKQTEFYNRDVEPLPYDPEGAQALLAQAGWVKNEAGRLEKDGKLLRFTLITNSGNTLRRDILAIAQNAWEKIGIEVRTDLLEWSVFLQERVNKLDFDALILGWSMSIEPDPYQIWHSSQTDPIELNFVGYQDPIADVLIESIRETYDIDRKIDYCHQLHERIAGAQPYTFLYVGKWTAVLDNRIVIKTTGPSGEPVFQPITPTKTGSYAFHFNRWIKLTQPPNFAAQG